MPWLPFFFFLFFLPSPPPPPSPPSPFPSVLFFCFCFLTFLRIDDFTLIARCQTSSVSHATCCQCCLLFVFFFFFFFFFVFVGLFLLLLFSGWIQSVKKSCLCQWGFTGTHHVLPVNEHATRQTFLLSLAIIFGSYATVPK